MVRRAVSSVTSVASVATSVASGTVGSIRRGLDMEKDRDRESDRDFHREIGDEEAVLRSARDKVTMVVKVSHFICWIGCWMLSVSCLLNVFFFSLTVSL